jgi:hypothetical protein
MTLGFSQELKGKPTYFIEKIWQSILENRSHGSAEYLKYQKAYLEKFGKYWDGTGHLTHEPVDSKKHTIRIHRRTKEGKISKYQWQESHEIHFAVNNQTKNRFQFAPIIPVVSIQDIFMSNYQGRFQITIDDHYLYIPDMEILAKNDGFDSLTDFKDYFIPQLVDDCLSANIIHWTNLKY